MEDKLCNILGCDKLATHRLWFSSDPADFNQLCIEHLIDLQSDDTTKEKIEL